MPLKGLLRRKGSSASESATTTGSIDKSSKNAHLKPGNSRKLSFRLKKNVASKVGDTRLGRTALTKLLGRSSGDEIIEHLKAAVVKIDGREKAKELKKDSLKWILKVSVMWKHKELNSENMSPVKKPAQLAAEIFIEIRDHRKLGSRDVTPIRNKLLELKNILKTVISPLSQEKNVDKLCNIIEYYSSTRFLNHLLNVEELENECNGIAKALKDLLESVSPLLNACNDYARYKYIQNIKNISFSMCVSGFPEITCQFEEFLGSRNDKGHRHSLRFLMAQKEYENIDNKNTRIQRGKLIYDKFLGKDASHEVQLNQEVQNEIDKKKGTGICSLYRAAANLVKKDLSLIFENEYIQSSMYKETYKKLDKEANSLRETYGNNMGLPDTYVADFKRDMVENREDPICAKQNS